MVCSLFVVNPFLAHCPFPPCQDVSLYSASGIPQLKYPDVVHYIVGEYVYAVCGVSLRDHRQNVTCLIAGIMNSNPDGNTLMELIGCKVQDCI
jgi:hypothetical protein